MDNAKSLSELDNLQNRIEELVDQAHRAVEILVARANRTFGHGGDLVRVSPDTPQAASPSAPPDVHALARVYHGLDRLTVRLNELNHVAARFEAL